jgi:hypothetical protein
MKRIILYVLIACTGVLNSCKKNELPKSEETSDPVFYFKGNVNGVPVIVQAGENGYYMNSSRYLDQNGLYVYRGELRQSNCGNNCGYSLAVLINDYKFSNSNNSSTNVDSGLYTGAYAFTNGSSDPLAYTAVFEAIAQSQSIQNSWNFSNGLGSSPNQDTAMRVLPAGNIYSVTMTSSDFNGCSASHTNVFKIGRHLQTTVSSEVLSGKHHFSAIPVGGTGPYTYLWDFNDNSTQKISTLSSPEHVFIPQTAPYNVKLTLIDALNDTCVSYYQVNTTTACQANFKATFRAVQNVKALSAITIQVTDKNGVVYSSNELNQSSGSVFEILSVEEYKQNERLEPTKKIKIKFNCSLISNIGPITINNGEAVIAVSYK